MKKLLKKLFNKSKGQGSVEYGILIALISIAVISSLFLLGGEYVDGECNINPDSDKLNGNYEYVKNNDTGITSLYKNVTCVLGGWGDEIPNEIEPPIVEAPVIYKENPTVDEAETAGFRFTLFYSITHKEHYYRINYFKKDKVEKGQKLVIPRTISHKEHGDVKVRFIESTVFNNKGIEHLVIPEFVETIYYNTFAYNRNLQSVEIKGENTHAHSSSFPSVMPLKGHLEKKVYLRKN